LFRVHNWRTDIETLGELPASFIREQSEGKLNYTWPAQVNRLISQGGFDLILSIGQVVPHEVIGMANHAKNILIGTGGREGINRSHYLGAVYGMERIMGRAENPVRNVLNRAAQDCFCGICLSCMCRRSSDAARMAASRCAASSSATISSAS
jgi:nickel-dependent lactate racemase